MDYDVVIATRNRPESLRSCLDLWERQTVRPTRVIVSDASDDHDAVEAFAMASRTEDVEWHFLRSPVRCTAAQRNAGLELATRDVAIVPDDDSMFYPDAAERLLEAYSLDKAGAIGGVTATLSGLHPAARVDRPTMDPSVEPSSLSWAQALRKRVEDRGAPSPFISIGKDDLARFSFPDWVDGHTYSPVPHMAGYQMSFRTGIAKLLRFDETLGYGVGYSTHEDLDLCVRLYQAGYGLIATDRAWVYHEAHAGARAGGYDYGFAWILNTLYAYEKFQQVGGTARFDASLRRFLTYKVAGYVARAAKTRTSYNVEVARGAVAAAQSWHRLRDGSDLVRAYRNLCDEKLTGRRQADAA